MSPIVTIIISATVGLISPLIALEVEKWLDSRHESRNRKLTIFKNLMAYRATLLSPQFVQSLNLVDLEFNGKSMEEKMFVTIGRYCSTTTITTRPRRSLSQSPRT